MTQQRPPAAERPASPFRPRVARFTPPRRPESLALYPRHVLLAALVAGLLAGPRSSSAAVLLAGLPVIALAALRLRGSPRADGASRDAGDDAAGARALARRLPPLAAVAAIAVLLGAVVAGERLRSLDRTTLRPHAGAVARGFVTDAPRTRARGTSVAPVLLHRPDERVLVRAPARVRWPAVRIGDEIVARGRLRALEPWEAFERRRGVHAVLDAERIDATGAARGSPLDRIRRRAEDALGTGLPAEQAALARGMVLGQDHALSSDLRDAFRASGLAHLVAASGTNVMLLVALVLAVATAAGVRLRLRLALAIAAVAVYVPVAGAGPSIQRAGVMGAAGLVAALAGRPATRWYALLLAAAATLVLDPRAAEDPGWQLSFAAVFAILALHGRLSGALVEHRTPRPVADVAALTIAATLGTAPLLMLHFGELSLVSLPANLLAAPAVAPVMWLGTASGAVGGDAAAVLNAVAAFPLAYLAWLGRGAAALPHASVPLGLPGPVALVAMYAALALAVAGARRARRRVGTGRSIRPVAALLVAGAGLVLVLGPGRPDPPDGLALSLLDVGQGDAILLQDGPHAVLVDTGPPGAPLVAALRAAGVQRLDAVLVTHSSADHEGGLGAVLAALPVGLVVDGRGPGRDDGGEGGGARFAGLPPGLPRAVPSAGQVIRAGRLRVEVLWPPPGEERRGDPNLTATVALARLGATTALLTADAESPVLLPLDLPDVDVLKVPHHGSQDAGLRELLARTTPEIALVPVGANTYGHPRPETLAALRRAVPRVHRTDEEGTVTLALGR